MNGVHLHVIYSDCISGERHQAWRFATAIISIRGRLKENQGASCNSPTAVLIGPFLKNRTGHDVLLGSARDSHS